MNVLNLGKHARFTVLAWYFNSMLVQKLYELLEIHQPISRVAPIDDVFDEKLILNASFVSRVESELANSVDHGQLLNRSVVSFELTNKLFDSFPLSLRVAELVEVTGLKQREEDEFE